MPRGLKFIYVYGLTVQTMEDKTFQISASSVIVELPSPAFYQDTDGAVFTISNSAIEVKLVRQAILSFEVAIIDAKTDVNHTYLYTDMSNDNYNDICDLQRPQ